WPRSPIATRNISRRRPVRWWRSRWSGGPVGPRLASRQRGPASIEAEVDFGVAELRPDPDHPGGWTLLLDGYPQSYVDAGDPRHLEFEYVRRLASVADLAAPPGLPLATLHLGGGALTLPRYLAATRPRSSQRVVERDARLTGMVRGALPLPR